MNQREAKAEGFAAGQGIGTFLETDIKDEEEFIQEVLQTEENARCMSPFEFFAHEVNEAGDRAEGLWEAYDDGVRRGAKAAWKARTP